MNSAGTNILSKTQLGRQDTPAKVSFEKYEKRHPSINKRCPKRYQYSLKQCEDVCLEMKRKIERKGRLTVENMSNLVSSVRAVYEEEDQRAKDEEKLTAKKEVQEMNRRLRDKKRETVSGEAYLEMIAAKAAELCAKGALASRKRSNQLKMMCEFLNTNIGKNDQELRKGLYRSMQCLMSMRKDFLDIDVKAYEREMREDSDDMDTDMEDECGDPRIPSLTLDDLTFANDSDGESEVKNIEAFVKRKLKAAKKQCKVLGHPVEQFQRLKGELEAFYTEEARDRMHGESKDREEDDECSVNTRNICSGKRRRKERFQRSVLINTELGAYDNDPEDSDYLDRGVPDSDFSSDDEDM